MTTGAIERVYGGWRIKCDCGHSLSDESENYLRAEMTAEGWVYSDEDRRGWRCGMCAIHLGVGEEQ